MLRRWLDGRFSAMRGARTLAGSFDRFLMTSHVKDPSRAPRNRASCFIGSLPSPLLKLLDGVAGADIAAFQDAAEHAATAPEFLAQPGADALHLIAGRAHHGDFEDHFAHAEALPNREAIHVEAGRREVFAENAGRQLHSIESFAVHQQHLPSTACFGVGASFYAKVC